MSTLLFLTIRVLHVVLAGAWLGAVMYNTFMLGPTVKQMGPTAAPVMAGLVRRGVVKYLASIGGTTVLTGIYLFWRFTGGFDPAASGSRAGIMFTIGALTGVIALILGGMVGGSAKKLVDLGPRVANMSEGAERAGLMSTMEILRGRIETFGRIVTVLLLISMAVMALGHYI
jgi:hypothetical protein